ncbi:MipA/OmpV family protein [Thorsellia kenyensis]|uniref:MipA/OmpV family protein n=1 Tax=Thorsellia kenyensis TaxID=1549888 RepID=A0ABV6CBG8_9GAMM
MKIKKNTLLSLFAVSGLMVIGSVQANDVTLGLGVGYSTQPYLGVSNDVIPLPVIKFENDQFFFNTTKAGYFLWNDGQQKVNVNISYHPQSFKGRDSDNVNMRALDRRRETAMVGIGYDVTGVFGKLAADVSGDVLNRSNGIIADANYSYPITHDLLTLAPIAGIKWNSDKYNDYYYGVSANEANRTPDFKAYKSNSGVSPYMGAGLNFKMTDNWNAFGMAQHTFFNKQIKDSPMISSSGQTLVGGGLSYSF